MLDHDPASTREIHGQNNRKPRQGDLFRVRILLPILFCLGSFICAMNFYLSFLRFPIFLLRGGRKSEYQWISGAPFIGSVSAAVGLTSLYETHWILISGLFLILIDTGGLHWFLGTMIYQCLGRTDKNVQDQTP
jgi:hypothetical protein